MAKQVETKAAGRDLQLWEEQGRHVLMMMPYADEIIHSAEGSWLLDGDGNRILDLASGMFCALVGHQHPKVTKRVVEQTQALLHTGTQFLSPAVLEASTKLAQVTPSGLSQSILLSTGTEANEFALWAARTVTTKQTVLGFSRGYYGTSVATKSCSSLFTDNTAVAAGFARIPIAGSCLGCFKNPMDPCSSSCLEDVEEMLASEIQDLAAVLVEPIVSAGGMFFPPTSFLRRLKLICEERNALFIVDEAQTCLGRTGKWFAIEHHGIVPDVLVLAKGAGNGVPVSAVVVNDHLAERLVKAGKFHLSSHQSDPVPAAALSAVIDVVGEENLLQAASIRGEYFVRGLTNLAQQYPQLEHVRGQGLMIGFDISGASDAVQLFMLGCRKRRVHVTYTFASPTIRIIPPLTISESEIDFALAVFAEVLGELARGGESLKRDYPRNRFTANLMSQSRWGRLVSRMWETSPEYWVRKLRERS